MDLKRNFLKGVTDKDSDERLLPEGVARDFLNIRVLSSEGSDVGSIENCLGNEKLTNLDIGDIRRTIGKGKSISLNCIYWLVKSTTGCYFIEYNISKRQTTIILEDTRDEDTDRVLNLKDEYSGFEIIIIEDTDNDAVYSCWSDGNAPIRFVNIERAKGYGANNFGEDDISLIKSPPVNQPTIIPIIKRDAFVENNLSEKFLRFGYRYKYLDGEYSAFSPFTNAVFLPGKFNYNFVTNSNESMVNDYSGVKVLVNTGSHLVSGIELLFKESHSNTVYKTSLFKKSDEDWDDNTDVEIVYDDKKIHGVVPESQLKRLYDAVPNKARSLCYIGGQLVFGNYEENYDLTDKNGDSIKADITLDFESSPKPIDLPYQSVKTMRDYEVGIVYMDDYGRMTSVLTSSGNTVYLPNNFSDQENKLKVTVRHLAPAFAKWYRFFIKQSRYEYDTLVCSLFYEDKNYRWIRLLPGERDKIKVGDYVIVKKDTSGLRDVYIETRILEISEQPVNFLDPDYEGDFPLQVSGVYFKIEERWFRMSKDDYQNYEGESVGVAGSTHPILPIINNQSYVEAPIYYGSNAGSVLSTSGEYTLDSRDIRFQIEIDGVQSPNTFRWSEDNGVSWTIGVPITGSFQPLAYGILISFASPTGNLMGDKWVLSAKGKYGDGYGSPGNGFGSHLDTRAYTYLSGPVMVHSGTAVDERIYAGATIQIYYRENGDHREEKMVEFTSDKEYANIEEWWIMSSVEDSFGFTFNKYWFRRGYSRIAYDNVTQFEVHPHGVMHWCVRSIGAKSSRHRAILTTKIQVIQSNRIILLETKSIEQDSEVFYEVGKTYPVSEDGFHLGGFSQTDSSQTSSSDAIIELDWYNCFGWGNGFESYKIKDVLNGKDLGVGTRGHSTLDEYRRNKRQSSITWSGVFEQSTNYNALNEFNLSKTNWIDLDPAFGSIQLLYSRDTNVVAFQENRVQPLGYRKTEIFDQSGNPMMVKSDQVFTIMNAYAGEYGMSHPESFAAVGNRLYWVDSRRGTPLRLSQNGISELSKFGYRSFFKKLFREVHGKFHASFDPYFEEYVLTIYEIVDSGVFSLDSSSSIGFSEDSKGWTSRYSFGSEGMMGLNNEFYSFYGGQLYRHNSNNVPRNNFYGTQYKSLVHLIFNDSPSDDKIFRSLHFEGSHPWDVRLATNLTEGVISKEEFDYKESRWFAYTRRNEREGDMTSLNVIGLGEIVKVSGVMATFSSDMNYLSMDDNVYQIVNGESLLIGQIKTVRGRVIEFKNIVNYPVRYSYCYAQKDARVEGGNMRGYYMEVILESDSTEAIELFSVGTKISKSYV